MAENEKLVFELDLDNELFLKKALESQEKINELSDPSNWRAMLSSIIQMGPYIAAVIVGIMAVKSALDLIGESEAAEKINNQFKLLSDNAGIAGEKIREDLVKSVHGLAGEEDILKSANEAIVMLGKNASKLPEIMELARKTTEVFGGDLLENFNKISSAIATGRVRSLKQMGLDVGDLNKIYQKFAERVGGTAKELNEFGKQQALLNAALDAGSKKLSGITPNLETTGNSFKRMWVSVKEAVRSIAFALDSVAGNSIRNFLNSMAKTADVIRITLEDSVGKGSQKASAHVESLTKRIEFLNKEIDRANQQTSESWFFSKTYLEKRKDETIKILRNARDELVKEINDSKKKISELSDEDIESAISEPDKEPKDQGIFDNSAKLEAENKFQKQVLQLKEEYLKNAAQLATSEQEVNALMEAQKLIIVEQTEQKISEIRNNKDIEARFKDELILNEQTNLNDKLALLENDKYDKQLAALDNYSKKVQGTQNQMAAGFMAQMKKETQATDLFAKVGAGAFTSLKSHSMNALAEMGAGTKDFSDIAKGAMLGMLADVSRMEGEAMILRGIGLWPAGGGMIAAGAALVALSGAIGAMAGGGGGSIGGSSGGSSGGYNVNSPQQSSGAMTQPTEQAVQRKSVTVQLYGDYLDTQATQVKLLDAIRNATDATDFKYFQIKA